jgi:hypothetical protein
MREFMKEYGEPPQQAERRFVAASTLSSLLAPVAAVLGLATLFGYAPVRETMELMGIPRALIPWLGVLEIAAAIALVVPLAAFFGAVVMAALCIAGALLYLPLGETGFAAGLAVVAAIYVVDVVVRAPELLARGRRLWGPAASRGARATG